VLLKEVVLNVVALIVDAVFFWLGLNPRNAFFMA
jgi:hypothetical protein